LGEVVEFTGYTYLDIPPDRVLENCKDLLDSVVLIGYTKEGEEFFSSSIADGADVLWLLERAKLKLLTIVDPI